MSIFSNRLKNLRKDKNITQKQVAQYLKITERAYQNYEYGNREPNLETIILIADFLDTTIDYLVGRSEDSRFH